MYIQNTNKIQKGKVTTMKNEKMVTRTISSTKAIVKAADMDSNAIVEKEIVLAGTYKSNDDVLKAVRAKGIEGNYIPVMIASAEVIEKLYGMTESTFMQYAKELPPRKVYEQ